MLLDEVLPGSQFSAAYGIDIHAPPARVWDALDRVDLHASPAARLLLTMRRLPVNPPGGNAPDPAAPRWTIATALRFGFVELARDPGRERVLGLVGRFWTWSGDVQRVDAAEFRAFDRPGFAKVAWNFHCEPRVGGLTRLDTETRIRCLDGEALKRFRRYWFLVKPFSGWLRKIFLQQARAIAERGIAG